MPLGTEIDLGSSDIVLDGDPAPPPKKGAAQCRLQFWPIYCGQTAAWIKIPLGMEVGLGPGHNVLDGEPAPHPKKVTAPSFWPMSIVATVAHLVYCSGLVMAALCNRGPLYFCPVVSFFLSIFFFLFFSSTNLSGCRLDVYHTSTRGVALVRI